MLRYSGIVHGLLGTGAALWLVVLFLPLMCLAAELVFLLTRGTTETMVAALGVALVAAFIVLFVGEDEDTPPRRRVVRRGMRRLRDSELELKHARSARGRAHSAVTAPDNTQETQHTGSAVGAD